MSIPPNVSMSVAVADPMAPTRVIKPNADGSINIAGGGTSGSSVPMAPGKGGAATGTTSQVAANIAAQTILAANANRIGAGIYYDAAAILYLIVSTTTPTSSVYTVKMGSGLFTYYELPAGYTGIVRGIWSVATGSANVTEWTA